MGGVIIGYEIGKLLNQQSCVMVNSGSSANLVAISAAKKYLLPTVLEPLKDLVRTLEETNWSPKAINEAIESVCSQHNIGFGKIGQPIRVAITGTTVSPPIDITLSLLPKNVVVLRLEQAVTYIESKSNVAPD